ncbi:hypothetical protein KQI89_07875 [Clostridium sp. MSJ-4]|uniref:Uncharacterized protein n=1 Tax=Clostridium simiarum TaxID=2841506 RepID=A0ABS6F2B3_9CLOT|nr:hypothetical protein [Clostridium simiarum]
MRKITIMDSKQCVQCCGKSATRLTGILLFDCQTKSRHVICRLSVIMEMTKAFI